MLVTLCIRDENKLNDSIYSTHNKGDRMCKNFIFQSEVAIGNGDPQTTLPEENKVRNCINTLNTF